MMSFFQGKRGRSRKWARRCNQLALSWLEVSINDVLGEYPSCHSSWRGMNRWNWLAGYTTLLWNGKKLWWTGRRYRSVLATRLRCYKGLVCRLNSGTQHDVNTEGHFSKSPQTFPYNQ
jgi:hypothetical protein